MRNLSSGKAAWNALVHKYEPRGMGGKVELLRELMKLLMREREDPDICMMRLDALVRKLRGLGLTIPVDLVKGLLLSKLPSNYETIVTIMEADEDLEYEEMKERIRTFWKRQIRQVNGDSGEDSVITSNKAMVGSGCEGQQ